MMLYKNAKVIICSPDGDTDFFDIVPGVLRGDTLAPYLFIIFLGYVLRTSIDLIKENCITLIKATSRRYPTWTITDVDCADAIELLANTPTQAESLLHSLEQAVGRIGILFNADKTDFMCFNQTGDIFTLNGRSLKLVNKFTYIESSVSSTENNINTRRAKAWAAIDRLSFMKKSGLSDKVKHIFFHSAVVSILLNGWTTWTLTKRMARKIDGNWTRMLRFILNKSTRQHPKKEQL